VISSFSMRGNINCVLLTLVGTLIILPHIFNCPYPSICHICANACYEAINFSSNSYKFYTKLMTKLVEILWRIKYLGSLLIPINFVQVQHTNKLPNNLGFVISKLDTYFVNCWVLFLIRWKVCNLKHNLSQPTHSCIGESFILSLYSLMCHLDI
jgi:hypothetical protein